MPGGTDTAGNTGYDTAGFGNWPSRQHAQIYQFGRHRVGHRSRDSAAHIESCYL